MLFQFFYIVTNLKIIYIDLVFIYTLKLRTYNGILGDGFMITLIKSKCQSIEKMRKTQSQSNYL
jgi:hypothetical protein